MNSHTSIGDSDQPAGVFLYQKIHEEVRTWALQDLTEMEPIGESLKEIKEKYMQRKRFAGYVASR